MPLIRLWYISNTSIFLLWYIFLYLHFDTFEKIALIHLFFLSALIISFLSWYENTLIYLFLILQNILIPYILIFTLIFSSLLWHQNKKKRKKNSFHIYCSDTKSKEEKKKFLLWTIFDLIRKFYNLTIFYIRKEEIFFK